MDTPLGLSHTRLEVREIVLVVDTLSLVQHQMIPFEVRGKFWKGCVINLRFLIVFKFLLVWIIVA